jgi:hypothetical protein
MGIGANLGAWRAGKCDSARAEVGPPGLQNRGPGASTPVQGERRSMEAEEDFFARGLGGGDGGVERIDDGRGNAEVADDSGGK